MKNLHKKIKGLRNKTSQRDMAHALGISASTLCRIEKGELPDLKTFRKLCIGFNVDANWLLGID